MIRLTVSEGFRCCPGDTFSREGGRSDVARELRLARRAGAEVVTLTPGARWSVEFPPGRLAASGIYELFPL